MQELLDQLLLSLGDGTVAGQLLHTFAGGNVLHVPASLFGFDVAAFLYELRHGYTDFWKSSASLNEIRPLVRFISRMARPRRRWYSHSSMSVS